MIRLSRVLSYGLALAAVIPTLALLRQASAQTSQRCFSATSHCVAGAFRTVWEQSGLAVFGLPLGPQGAPAAGAATPDGPAQVQWFERQRIELHPANAQPYNVQLGRLGAERFEQLGRDWRDEPPAAPEPGCRYFPATGRNLCPPFLEAWRASGVELDGAAGLSEAESLALFGLPLTGMREETVEGRVFRVQWFERARFELHEVDGAERVLLGRLGVELQAGGAALDVVAGAAPTQAPADPRAPSPAAAPTTAQSPEAAPTTAQSPEAAPTTAPRQPTPAATRAPRRPTATNEPNEPEPTSPAEPSSTAVPPTSTSMPPTSTPLAPTSTAAPPTSTPRPPTATPLPDPFKDPPPVPPPGFPGGSGLPSQNTSSVKLADLDSATDTLSIGAPICFEVDRTETEGDELSFSFVGPDGDTITQEEVTITGIAGNGSPRLRWAPGLGYLPGAYTITATETDLTGTVTLSVTGSLSFAATAPGSGALLTAVRLGDRFSDEDVSSCNDGANGRGGDDFVVYLTGFAAGERVELHLYGAPDCTTAAVCYRGLIETVTVDDQGQGVLEISTDGSYRSGDYIIVTRDQALAAAGAPDLLASLSWEQRITLR